MTGPSIKQAMHDNPNGRQCSVCGHPVKAAPRGVKATACSACVADRVAGPKSAKESKEHEKEVAKEARQAGRGKNVIEAAIEALRMAGKPMATKELTQMMIDEGLWSPGGATPDRTVYASIFKHPAFKKVGPSKFALDSSAEQSDT